jgi:hypothetical protein
MPCRSHEEPRCACTRALSQAWALEYKVLKVSAPSTGLHRVMAKSTAAAELAGIGKPTALLFQVSSHPQAMNHGRRYLPGRPTCNRPHRDVWSGDPNDEH